MAGHAGLVQKKVNVRTKKGKTVQRSMWVRAQGAAKGVARFVGRHKGKIAAGAAIAGGLALGIKHRGAIGAAGRAVHQFSKDNAGHRLGAARLLGTMAAHNAAGAVKGAAGRAAGHVRGAAGAVAGAGRAVKKFSSDNAGQRVGATRLLGAMAARNAGAAVSSAHSRATGAVRGAIEARKERRKTAAYLPKPH